MIDADNIGCYPVTVARDRQSDAAKPVLAVVAVATFQYEVLPYVEGAEFAQLVALNVAIEGAVGGAINTGTLRGSLTGAATAEAFWGVGNLIQSSSGLGIPGNPNFSSLTSGQVIGAVGLHAAVGCVSSVASGGRCGSGALSAGLGELTTGYTQDANPFVQGAVTALAGGTGAALTGGRFGDGFFIAASGYLFNNLQHTISSATGAEQSGIQLAAASVTDPNTGEHLLPGQTGAPVIGGGGGDISARTPIGTLSSSDLNVQPGTNPPATINGLNYTGHALDQMQSRGIMPSVVEDTIRTGTQSPGYDGATRYTTDQARVIINPNGSVKTVYPQ